MVLRLHLYAGRMAQQQGARLEHDRAINKLKQKVFYEDGLRGIRIWTE